MAGAGAGAVNRTPSPAPGPGVWPGIIGRDHHIWPGPGPGMGINPPPAPGIHGAGNPGRFLYSIQLKLAILTNYRTANTMFISIIIQILDVFKLIPINAHAHLDKN